MDTLKTSTVFRAMRINLSFNHHHHHKSERTLFLKIAIQVSFQNYIIVKDEMLHGLGIFSKLCRNNNNTTHICSWYAFIICALSCFSMEHANFFVQMNYVYRFFDVHKMCVCGIFIFLAQKLQQKDIKSWIITVFSFNDDLEKSVLLKCMSNLFNLQFIIALTMMVH